MANSTFKTTVQSIVATIPSSKVMTYGQIAALAGKPNAARVVGGIAHYGDPTLPWHRVVSKKGGLASGFPGGRIAHKALLEAEGVKVTDDMYIITVDQYIWWP